MGENSKKGCLGRFFEYWCLGGVGSIIGVIGVLVDFLGIFESFGVFELLVINVGCQGSGLYNILSCN